MKQLIIVCCVLLAGCMGPVKTEPVSRYQINAPSQQAYRKAASSKTLLVSKPISDPGFHSAKMLYVKTPYQLQNFATHEWVMPPADMIQTSLTSSLQASKIFRAVVRTPYTAATDYRLETNLITLQQEFLRPESCVRLSLQVSLIDDTSHKIMSSQRFTTTVRTPSNTPYGGVQATHTALLQLEAQILPWINRQIG